jgi:hypothetical protein
MSGSENVVRTYGNWKRPSSAGILGLGTLGTALLGAHLVIAIVILMSNVVFGVGWFVIGGGLMYLIVRKDKHNMSILYRAMLRRNWKRQKNAKRGIYKSGPLSKIPNGNFRLPSIGANTGLISYFDPQGREVGVLVHNNRFFTIILHSEPEGAQLVDQETVDLQVARYSTFLNSLNNEPGLRSVSVTVESEPENGLKLQSEVLGHLSKDASIFAKATMHEIAQNYSVGSASVNIYTALTYTMADFKMDQRPFEDVLREITGRIPMMASQLQAAGAGVVRTLPAAKIFKVIRTAFDPSSKELFDKMDLEGDTLVDWPNVGPALAVNEWDSYTTDSAKSRTYVMSQPPKGEVFSNVLERVLAPRGEFIRKRVTMVYKPMQFEESAMRVEQDLTNAQFRANSEKQASARQLMAVRQAQQTAMEEAQGATLIRFGMIVTITIANGDDISTADAVMTNLSAASHIVLRSANGTQDTAFLAGLPLGLPIETYYSTFDSIKDMI